MLRQKIAPKVHDELYEKHPNGNHHDVKLEHAVIELQADRYLRADFQHHAIDVELISKIRN